MLCFGIPKFNFMFDSTFPSSATVREWVAMHKYPAHVANTTPSVLIVYIVIFLFLGNPLKGATFYVMHSRTETFCHLQDLLMIL